MTSINFNAAASSALRTLQHTNASLDTTQNRISTGLKIGQAKDNAAYWSISTTLKSDNKALGTVKDALGLGAATVDTAYQGLNAAIDVMNEIKSKLTAATQDGVDKVAVQAEIEALQSQLKAIAGAATFSGENWLSAVDADAASHTEKKYVVSSFNRDGDNVVKLDTIEIDTTNVLLIDNGTKSKGILNTPAALTAADTNFTFGASGNTDTVLSTATPGEAEVTTNADFPAAGFEIKSGQEISFNVTLQGVTKAVKIDLAAVKTALTSNTDGTISSVANWATVLQTTINTAFTSTDTYTAADGTTQAIPDITVAADGQKVKFTSGVTSAAAGAGTPPATPAVDSILTIGTVTYDSPAGVLDFDVSGKTREQITAFVNTLSAALDKTTSAAAALGAIASRIDLQKDFVTTLMDTIDKGVSGLVDADMNEESTKLQALQVKQQLGVQALSIANQSAQNVLSLFRS